MTSLTLSRRQIAFRGWIILLVGLMAIGVVSALQVFIHGLVITNLSDQVPWGLWITVDLSAVALSGGAFFLCALTYIAGIESFKPAARLATFIGLLGYSAALCTLLLDIGRPDRFYHPLVFWNTHSMLWEVTMCICLYFSVLLLEVFPMVTTHPVFERRPKIRAIADKVHHAAPILAFLGLGFSMLHQSSLGATYGVLNARPIWFRPTLPLLFIVSAMAAGPALTIAVAQVGGWLRGRSIVPRDVLFAVGQVSGVMLFIFLYMRFWDSIAGNYGYVPLRTEATQVLTQGTLALSFWSWEIILGGLIPVALLIGARLADSDALLFIGSAMAVVGLVVHRWNTTMVGLLTPLTQDPAIIYPVIPTYTPSLVEWGVVTGIVAGILLALTLGLTLLPVFDEEKGRISHATPT